MMKNEILITGGTGFIGRFLIPELLARGWSPIILSRQPIIRVQHILSPEVLVINHVNEIPETANIKACINLAGESIFDEPWRKNRKKVLSNSRIDVTHRLCQYLEQRQSPPEVVISGSAIGYYGTKRKDDLLTEHDAPGDDFAAQLCIEWEAAAHSLSTKTRLCLLRTGVVLHQHYGMLANLTSLFKMGFGGHQGKGSQMISWIHIQDMVNVILFLLEDNTIFGPVNAVAPRAVTNHEFMKTLAKVLRRPCFMHVPEVMLRLALGERASLVLSGANVSPAKLMKHNFVFVFPELIAALADLY